MRIRYAKEFKRSVVAAVRAGMKASRISAVLGVSSGSISAWKRRYRNTKSATPFKLDPVPLYGSAEPVLASPAPVRPWRPTDEEVGAKVCAALDAMQSVINALQARSTK